MNKYKMYYCNDYNGTEIREELMTDSKKEAYEFFRTANSPLIIYGIKISNLNDFKEIKDEAETKIP